MTYAIISSDNKLIAAPVDCPEIDNLPEATRNQYGWYNCSKSNPDFNPDIQERILFQVTRRNNDVTAHFRLCDKPLAEPWITVKDHAIAKLAIISDFRSACDSIFAGAANLEQALETIQAGIDDVCQSYDWVDNPPEPEV